jgi:hypothetical protein
MLMLRSSYVVCNFLMKSHCSHDTMIKNGTSNYFERLKHANECHNKFNHPLYLPKKSKLHDINSHTIKKNSNNCNYYKRGGWSPNEFARLLSAITGQGP